MTELDEQHRMEGQCRKCGAAMRPGIALAQTYTGGAPDMGEVCTMSPGWPGKLVECEKCSVCGWSTTLGPVKDSLKGDGSPPRGTSGLMKEGE